MSCLSSKSTKVLWAENFTILIEKERERQSYLFVVFHPWFSARLKYEKIQSSSWKSVVIIWRNEGTARCRCLKCNDVWTLCGEKTGAKRQNTLRLTHIYRSTETHWQQATLEEDGGEGHSMFTLLWHTGHKQQMCKCVFLMLFKENGP